MRTFVRMLPNGLVAAMVQTPDDWQGDPGDMEAGYAELAAPPEDPFDAAAWWWTGSDWTRRGTLPEPVVTSPNGERHLVWTGLPEGATAHVEDTETGVQLGTEAETDGGVTVELVEPGAYRVSVTCPPAWRAQHWMVTL